MHTRQARLDVFLFENTYSLPQTLRFGGCCKMGKGWTFLDSKAEIR